ncbi:hypothetical protein ZWY2020_041677 [Hordeum vulgare]|nr:hypothetical protein ZWY2020_041677 [Hordeum vulgare]
MQTKKKSLSTASWDACPHCATPQPLSLAVSKRTLSQRIVKLDAIVSAPRMLTLPQMLPKKVYAPGFHVELTDMSFLS